MQKTISGFLLAECVHVSCTHTHTHPSCLCKEVFLTWSAFSIPFLVRNKVRPRFGGYHTSCRTVGRRGDGGTVTGMPPALGSASCFFLHPFSPFSAVQCPGATSVTRPPLPPQPWLLPSESVWQLCQRADAMGQGPVPAAGAEGSNGATLEPALK